MPNRAWEAGSLSFRNEPSSLLLELEGTRRALAAANRQIARLLRMRRKHRRTISHLTTMAMTDVLTELGNRRCFEEVLEASFTLSVARGSSLSLILVDVDGFKSYNDTFGHSAGDVVLCVIAGQLIKSSRPDDVVTRYGGEEFAILLPGTDETSALSCAERHREAIESFAWPLRLVTASFGVATRGAATQDPSTLVDEADHALYCSKRSGRNRVTHRARLEAMEPSTPILCNSSAGGGGTPFAGGGRGPFEVESSGHPQLWKRPRPC